MSEHTRNYVAVTFAGSVSLAIAMGVGRFAFTPILPIMLHDGVLDLHLASQLATANYVGYLVGALSAMIIPKKWDHAAIIHATLISTVLLTAAMAVPFQSAWVSLRFLAGVISAIGFVFTSGWCLAELSHSPSSIGSAIYTGPGAGIALTGLAAVIMTTMGFSANAAWLIFAVMSAMLSILVWSIFQKQNSSPDVFAVGTSANKIGKVSRSEVPLFALAYGLAGFGYIITATYLPVIAKNSLPNSALQTIFWPMFGFAAVAGSLLAARVGKAADVRLYLIGAYLMQAVGVALSIVWHSAVGLTISSVLVGLPFTAISYFAMNEVRRIRSHHHARYMGLLTAVFAVGQILGPPSVGLILRHVDSVETGFELALGIASITLVIGAAIYVFMILSWPLTKKADHGIHDFNRARTQA
jgi:MFS family permease